MPTYVTTHDYISIALNLTSLERLPDISSYAKEPIPAWNKGINHFGSKENHPCYGKPISVEHRNKIAAARLGSKHSEKTRLKMSQSKKGRSANCSMLGKKHSEETKRKIAEAAKRRWDARR